MKMTELKALADKDLREKLENAVEAYNQLKLKRGIFILGLLLLLVSLIFFLSNV